MEHFIHNDNPTEDKKAIVKSWIYKWLSNLEVVDIREARRTESGDTETIVIKFKH